MLSGPQPALDAASPSESVSSVAMPVALFSQSGPLPAATRITRIWTLQTLNTGSLSCS